MARHIVARTSEIPPCGNKVFGVEGRDIVVFHVMASSSLCSIAVRTPARRWRRRRAWRG